MILPTNIETRLLQLSDELDSAQADMLGAEEDYYLKKADLEISLAKARLHLIDGTVKSTVVEREDRATVACKAKIESLAVAEVMVRAARSNMMRLRTQIDIARSLGASVRSSMEAV
jgi:hypothetical protein